MWCGRTRAFDFFVQNGRNISCDFDHVMKYDFIRHFAFIKAIRFSP